MMYNTKTYPCACSFAKVKRDRDPTQFPRVGMIDNVIYRGSWIIEHKPTGEQAIIRNPERPWLHGEADKCCFDWFDNPQGFKPPTDEKRVGRSIVQEANE